MERWRQLYSQTRRQHSTASQSTGSLTTSTGLTLVCDCHVSLWPWHCHQWPWHCEEWPWHCCDLVVSDAVDGVTVDWIAHNIYWTDTGLWLSCLSVTLTLWRMTLTLCTVSRRSERHWSGSWWRFTADDLDSWWPWSAEGDRCLPTTRVNLLISVHRFTVESTVQTIQVTN